MRRRIDKQRIIGNERGIVLTVVILLIAILVLLGSTAIMTTSTDLKISGNYKQIEQAFFNAEAGMEEARARLRGSNSDANYAGDPASSVDSAWSAYILTSGSWQTSDDSSYNSALRNYIPTTSSHTATTIAANTLQSPVNMNYAVKIRHKKEYDAEQNGHDGYSLHYYDGDGDIDGGAPHTAASAGNVIYYGYGDSTRPTTALQFTTSGATEHKPVEIITARGTSGSAVKIVEIEVVRAVAPPVAAAIYAKSDLTGNGSSMTVNGNDNCGVAAAKPPIATLTPSTTTLNGSPTLLGNPAAATQTTNNIDIQGYVNDLKGSANYTVTEDKNGALYGSSANYVTVYSDTSNPNNVQGLKLQNVIGYGTLLVDGDLELGGGFNWNGLILVTGTLTFNGGGLGVNILGAVLANQTVDINGGVDVRYDSCRVNNAVQGQSLKILSWKTVY